MRASERVGEVKAQFTTTGSGDRAGRDAGDFALRSGCHSSGLQPTSAQLPLPAHHRSTPQVQDSTYDERTGSFRSLGSLVIRRSTLTCPSSPSFIISSPRTTPLPTSLILSARVINQDVVETGQEQAETIVWGFKSVDSRDGLLEVDNTYATQSRRLTTPIPFWHSRDPCQPCRGLRTSSWRPDPTRCPERVGERTGPGSLECLPFKHHPTKVGQAKRA